MPLSTEVTRDIVQKFGKSETDNGSTEVQIALLTQRIRDLTEHLKEHKHDFHSTRGLMKLVGRRRRLMRYMEHQDVAKYRELIQELGIRG
jgi:small subunit ribosomal protein S15